MKKEFRMIEVNFYNEEVEDYKLEFAVIIAKHKGKFIFCKHKDRTTFELPGGHREKGELTIDTAKRELFEETGATEFEIQKICVYSVKGKTKVNKNDEDESFGMLYFADVKSLGELENEIESIVLSDKLIENWTYPLIQPLLIQEASRRGFI